MYTTDGHIIIALTAGDHAPCLHPTPSTDSRHRAAERATEPRRETGKADTHGQRQSHPGDRRSRSGDRIGGKAGERRRGRWADRTGGATVGQAKTGRATRRRSEPHRAPKTGTAPAEGDSTAAEADGAQRAAERTTAPNRYHINMYAPPRPERQSVENRAFQSPAEKSLKKIEKGVDK